MKPSITSNSESNFPLFNGARRHSRRHGRFTVPARWADEYRSELLRIMGKCVVFRAESLYHCNRLEYWAVSDHFREVPEGEMVPEYVWFFTDEGDFWCEEFRIAP